MKKNQTPLFQIIWGIILMLAGVAVFYRIPQKMPEIANLEIFSSIIPFVKFCFYLIGIVLFGGGLQKIYKNFLRYKKENPEE